MNPLIPTPYDVAWSVLVIAVLACSVAAIVSMVRTRGLSGGRFLLWLLLVLAAPLAGALAWFACGRRVEAARHDRISGAAPPR